MGFDPAEREIWELATAFGAHRSDTQPAGPPGFVMDDTIEEMLRAQKAYEQGGPEPQWGQPI